MTLQNIGRLAFREEGKWWNAYYADVGTMANALRLGSIRMTLVLGNPTRKDEFIALMREAWADVAEQKFGVRPEFPEGPRPAPEHERSGNA